MTPVVLVQPTAEPISLDRARRHLSLIATGDPLAHWEDPWITETLPACRQWCEQYTDRSLAPQTLEATFDAFPCMPYRYGDQRPTTFYVAPTLALPMGPVVSVTSLAYTDDAGAVQTLDPVTYELRDDGALWLAFGQAWPHLTGGVVRVRYLAGYAASGDTAAIEAGHPEIPGPIVSAMLLMLGHLHENRESSVVGMSVFELPLGVQSLLAPYRASMGV